MSRTYDSLLLRSSCKCSLARECPTDHTHVPHLALCLSRACAYCAPPLRCRLRDRFYDDLLHDSARWYATLASYLGLPAPSAEKMRIVIEKTSATAMRASESAHALPGINRPGVGTAKANAPQRCIEPSPAPAGAVERASRGWLTASTLAAGSQRLRSTRVQVRSASSSGWLREVSRGVAVKLEDATCAALVDPLRAKWRLRCRALVPTSAPSSKALNGRRTSFRRRELAEQLTNDATATATQPLDASPSLDLDACRSPRDRACD
jgi:hypothetical protein